MNKKVILSKINERISLINSELKDGYGVKEQNEMIIEEVLNNNLPTILNTKTISSFTDIHYLDKALNEIKNTMSIIRDEVDLNNFLLGDKNFDVDKLKEEYEVRNLKKLFPKFKIDKFLKLLNNPILEFKNPMGETIRYDLYWVKKNMIAIIQMIFNEMDIYILNIGKEGSGKSCWSSQQILYFYEFFSLVGLIDYSYDIQRMFFTDIQSFLNEHQVQKKNDFFRIECLDEGNELNRSDFRDEDNKQFKYEMRTERKMLRVILINVQQIGELDTSISLSRVNFIYDCKMKGKKKLGTLEKGFIDMYIIPRGNSIYSDEHKKVLSRFDILNSFAKILDKKSDYYVSLPSDMVVKKFKFENFWGFDKDAYDDYVKDEMKKRKFQKSTKITDVQAYVLLTKLSNFVKLGTFDRKDKNDDKMYKILNKFFKKIDAYFSSNPEKRISIERQYGKVYSKEQYSIK